MFFLNSEIGSHVKLPRSIKIEKVNEILHNLEVISPIFTEGSIIGFMKCREDNICTYMEENPIDSILKKILNLELYIQRIRPLLSCLLFTFSINSSWLLSSFLTFEA